VLAGREGAAPAVGTTIIAAINANDPYQDREIILRFMVDPYLVVTV
jgi:hypothetical protein